MMFTAPISAAGRGDSPIVTVVDSDVVVRDALGSLIRSASWIARTFSSAWDFLASPRALVAGCLVLDMDLPDLSGLELQQRVADRPEMPLIFMTRHADVLTTVRAMKAGAWEFMTKPFREDTMLGAIRSGIEYSRATLRRDAELHEIHNRYALLTCREREVMALVVQGLLNKLIGAKLGISEVTVKVHRGRMMRKMRAHSVPELVTIAARLSSAPMPVSHASVPVDTIVRSWPIASTPRLSA